MAGIIQILLSRKEENLACYLTAFYNISLTKEIVCYIVNLGRYELLKTVWDFDKNYYGDVQDEGDKVKIVYKDLFELIINIAKESDSKAEDEVSEKEKQIETVCMWKLAGDKDNILEALLYHSMDKLCLKYMGYYHPSFRGPELFLFSLLKNNKYFIEQSLSIGAFDKQIFKDE